MLRLCLVVLVTLRFSANCQAPPPSPDLQQSLKYLEEVLKPCILQNLNCPPESNMNINSMGSSLQTIKRYTMSMSEECKCELTTDACIRGCFYASTVGAYLIQATMGKTSEADIASAEKEAMVYLQGSIRPCIMEDKNCSNVGIVSGDRSRWVGDVKRLLAMYTLPDECSCDLNEESCIRQCYYSHMRRVLLVVGTFSN